METQRDLQKSFAIVLGKVGPYAKQVHGQRVVGVLRLAEQKTDGHLKVPRHRDDEPEIVRRPLAIIEFTDPTTAAADRVAEILAIEAGARPAELFDSRDKRQT